MRRTILSIAYALAPVGQSAVGGAEQVLSTLDRAITASGGASIVVACRGSHVRGALEPGVPFPRRIGPDAFAAAVDAQRAALRRVFDRAAVDLVHCHGIDFDHYLDVVPPHVPVLVTLHLPLAWYSHAALTPNRRNVFLNCVSNDQRRSAPAGLSLLDTIPNGVAIPERIGTSPSSRTHAGSAVAMGRICPEKGYHVALDAARAADADLRLAGRVFGYPSHLEYHAREIEPRLDARRRYIGPVSGDDKWRLLRDASCLLVPSLAPETSSLVAMEALACGTPVVALANGALREIVRHGETGFLARDAGEMADAIRAIRRGAISRDVCRDDARERFDAWTMVARYFSVYETLIGGGVPPSSMLA